MMPKLTFIVWFLAATSAWADSPVIRTHWESFGYEPAKPEEAEFSVTVFYNVRGVIKDSDTFYFKQHWTEVRELAGETSIAKRPPVASSGRSRESFAGEWCNGCANVQPQANGLNIDLDLAWGGEHSGQLKREFRMRWSELEKTVADKRARIHTVVRWRKA